MDINPEQLDLLNKRAALFQGLLVTKFHLAEKIGSRAQATKTTSGDLVENKSLIDELMRSSPDAQIRYSLRKIITNPRQTKLQVAQNRAANKFNRRVSSFRIKEWLRWLLNNKIFMRTYYLIVIWNMVAVVLDVEYGEIKYNDTEQQSKTKANIRWNLAIAQFILCILLLFELLSKWCLDFRAYWKSFWNYVDFFVVLTTIPFMGTFFGWYQVNFVGTTILQACRTLVALKLIHELNAMKAVFELLALTMLSMVYVIGFIVIMTYLCGLIGTTLFDTHTVPYGSLTSDPNETYSDSRGWEPPYVFSYGLGRSILVIFKLFTLDGWYRFYKGFIQVHEIYSASIFIFTWVFLSAFLLGNLFPALLITNFQRIRGQMMDEIRFAEAIKELSHEIAKLGDEIQETTQPDNLEGLQKLENDALFLPTSSVSDTSIVLDYAPSMHTLDGAKLRKSASHIDHRVRREAKDMNKPKRHGSARDNLHRHNLSSLLHLLPGEKDSTVKVSSSGASQRSRQSTSEKPVKRPPLKIPSTKRSKLQFYDDFDGDGSDYVNSKQRNHTEVIKTLTQATETMLSTYGTGTKRKEMNMEIESRVSDKDLDRNNNAREGEKGKNGKRLQDKRTSLASGSSRADTSSKEHVEDTVIEYAISDAQSDHTNASCKSKHQKSGVTKKHPADATRAQVKAEKPKRGSLQESSKPSNEIRSHRFASLKPQHTLAAKIPALNSLQLPEASLSAISSETGSGVSVLGNQGFGVRSHSPSKLNAQTKGRFGDERITFSGNVMHILRILSPFNISSKMRRLRTKAPSEPQEGDDFKDFEINVIDATPRASATLPHSQSRQGTSIAYLPDILTKTNRQISSQQDAPSKLLTTSSGTTEDKTRLSSQSQQQSTLRQLSQPGVKSKLNLLELHLTKKGQSLKIMRSNLGRKAKMVPSDFDLHHKRRPSMKDSICSLRSIFLKRNKYSESLIQEQMLKQELRKLVHHHELKATRWTETVHSCVPALQHIEITTEWSDIILLNYLHSMTELMENLKEREQLLNLMSECVISLSDDIQQENRIPISRRTASLYRKPSVSLNSRSSGFKFLESTVSGRTSVTKKVNSASSVESSKLLTDHISHIMLSKLTKPTAATENHASHGAGGSNSAIK